MPSALLIFTSIGIWANSSILFLLNPIPLLILACSSSVSWDHISRSNFWNKMYNIIYSTFYRILRTLLIRYTIQCIYPWLNRSRKFLTHVRSIINQIIAYSSKSVQWRKRVISDRRNIYASHPKLTSNVWINTSTQKIIKGAHHVTHQTSMHWV